MSSKSKFARLAGALNRKGTDTGEPKKIAKSKDKENYAQTTVYLSRDIYGDLQKQLTDGKLEYSQLVENLLRAWIKGQQNRDV